MVRNDEGNERNKEESPQNAPQQIFIGIHSVLEIGHAEVFPYMIKCLIKYRNTITYHSSFLHVRSCFGVLAQKQQAPQKKEKARFY